MKKGNRITWVDYTKLLAIVLVAVGHLAQSLVKSSLAGDTAAYVYFDSIIYSFHVNLFFICSGFLYQRLTKKQDLKGYAQNVLKKLVSFGVPYFVFSVVTYFTKTMFSGSVNSQIDGSLADSLFVEPIAPYWFLFTLFFLFLVSPVIKNNMDAIIRVIAATGIYFILQFCDFSVLKGSIHTIAVQICSWLIYFVLGMVIAHFQIDKSFKKSYGLFFILFLAAKIVSIKFDFTFKGFDLILSVAACFGVISFIGALCSDGRQNKVLNFLSKYTMPIFLMHTLFAAPVRIVLVKIGVTSLPVHIAAGLIASFALPILAAMIMERLKLDILYNPTKYCLKKSKNS